jgi:glycosyltransferase involved in cell wall biosynthesis
MNNQPRVSVVISFLDAEQFLPEAIESVFAQTFKKWELLLVDDGSSDSSSQIARRYSTEHPHTVRYLEHDGHRNRRLPASRNLGIRSAM